MKQHSKQHRNPLIHVDQQRLRAWIDKRRLSEKEIAARAGMRPQTLNQLTQGHVKRCRRDSLVRLARILGVRLSYLSGGPEAPLPEVETVLLDPFAGLKIKPLLEDAASPHRVRTRADVESTALLANLNRIMKSSLPSRNRVNGTQLIFRLDLLWMLIAQGDKISQPSSETMELFASSVAMVLDTLLAPWTGSHLPKPPKGIRMLSALANMATGLAYATIAGDTSTVEQVTEDIEKLVHTLNQRSYGVVEADLLESCV